MIASLRIGLGIVCALAAYFLTRPLMEMLFSAVRRRLGKRARWIGDIQRYLLVYLSWICVAVLWILIAHYAFDIGDTGNLVKGIYYFMAIPVVLATFALRKVVTNLFVRHLKWDRTSTNYDARIFIVTETIKFVTLILIAVEIFMIFFTSNQLATFLLVEVFLCMEIVLLLGGFTTLKNISTGLFLIFAEPFRTGSYCQMLHVAGFVEKVSLARTTLRRYDGSLVYIPNGIFSDAAQTNANPTGTFRHVVVINLHPATTLQSIRALREELSEVLPRFAATLEADMDEWGFSTSFQRVSASVALMDPPRNSDSHIVSSNGTAISVHVAPEAQDTRVQENKSCSVVLNDMYIIKVTMMIDQQLFTTLEAGKTEVNLYILEILQKYFAVSPHTRPLK